MHIAPYGLPAFVDVTSMAERHDDNEHDAIMNGVADAVIADTNP
jgi:hypothetical protein